MALKFLSSALGKFLISVSITFFVLSFLAVSLAENTDVLKSSLQESLISEEVLGEVIDTGDLTIEEAKEICKSSPEQENCDLINDPSKILGAQMDEQLDPLIQQVEDATQTMLKARTYSIIAFIIGILLLYFGTSSLILTAYKTSTTMLFSSIFYIILYKFIATSLPTLAEKATAQQEIPQELLKAATYSINAWLQTPIEKVISVCIILIIISLPIAIGTFILKRKHPQESTE